MRSLWLGRVDYAAAWQLQREMAARKLSGRACDDTLLLLEHPHTVTRGRGANPEHLLAGVEELSSRGISLYDVDRGGDVTYHGPGQLIGYPVLDLGGYGRDLHVYLRALEQVLMDAVSHFGLTGRRFAPHTGVWIGDRKIAAIGIKVSRWVTSHGFALNVNPDLTYYSGIVPCGIREYGVTSIEVETSSAVQVIEAIEPLARAFTSVLGGIQGSVLDTGAAEAASEDPQWDWLSETSQKILVSAIDVTTTLC